ncbi:MarR family transcriptional regulator [Pseudonocardia eucalypti]|uniref:MarR family transcriptional regulator n=2 Tax=Pseudonocardia eucalypti TaxID=648755 RepID=A0ABP9RDY2_9PSEU|nr:DNA-binding MarR family transcriptional regulator [Pseudonocardia eucalypti]
MAETRWLDEREQCAWRGYLAMNARLTAHLHRELQARSGLSLADFDVLVQLTDRPDHRARVLELAAALQWEKSRLSHHLARMRHRGLVGREDCIEDGRGTVVTLTPAGLRAIQEAAPAHVTTVREVFFDQLTAREVDTLRDFAERVLTRLDRPAGTTVPVAHP